MARPKVICVQEAKIALQAPAYPGGPLTWPHSAEAKCWMCTTMQRLLSCRQGPQTVENIEVLKGTFNLLNVPFKFASADGQIKFDVNERQ